MKKMMLFIFAIILVSITTGSAILPDAFYFDDLCTGQGANWKAEFSNKGAIVFVKNEEGALVCETHSSGRITITYTGDTQELWANQYFSYGYDASISSTEVVLTPNETDPNDRVRIDKTLTMRIHNEFFDKHLPPIQVKVDIDGHVDHFELNRVH
jgi:hypothetical protein